MVLLGKLCAIERDFFANLLMVASHMLFGVLIRALIKMFKMASEGLSWDLFF